MRSFLLGTIIFCSGLPLYAASTLTGSPLKYQPVAVNHSDASLQEIRARVLAGQLTADDILKAAEQIKAVQQKTDPQNAGGPAGSGPAPIPAAGETSLEPFYARAGTDLQIPVDDTSSPLGAAGHLRLNQVLDRLPLRHLFLLQQIQVAPKVSDPDRGQPLVQTEGGRLTAFGTSDLPQALTEGMAAIVYESMRGSPLEAEWRTHGDFADFVRTYEAWVEDTQQAFEQAKQTEQAPEELSRLFFVASLFTDEAQNRITTYNPAPQDVPLQVQQGHYGFGPYTFEVYRNQIVHLSHNGVLLSASAAAVPSLWTRQGLGN